MKRWLIFALGVLVGLAVLWLLSLTLWAGGG